MRKRSSRHGRGVVYVLAMLFLAIFSSLAVALATASHLNLRQSKNLQDDLSARLTAASGLAFVMHTMQGVEIEGPSDPDMLDVVRAHLAERMNGTANLGGGSVQMTGGTISVPEIYLADGQCSFHFTITQPNSTTLRLVVTGQSAAYCRQLAIDYDITEDVSVLKYAVASRSRIIMTDGAVVGGDVCSTWDRTRIGSYDIPPFLMEQGTEVQGDLKTVLSQEGFDEYNSGDYIEGEYGEMVYDEPKFAEYTTEDFDTASYKAGTTDITALGPPDYTASQHCFPSSTNIRRRIDRPVYENQTFDNIHIPVGHNPKFINCTFNRVIYIDTNETRTLSEWSHNYYNEHAIPNKEYRSDDRHNDESNNVIFENCTFNGPIITAVPRDYWWSKNALTFEGETTFTNSYMPESTILAPNFGVDIGGRGYDEEANPNSKLTGIIVGGIVDIRGTANIEGTILSMYYPDTDRGTGARYYGTNIGYYDDGGETGGATGFPGDIRIVPQPDGGLPFGIRKRYTVASNPDTYVELTP